MLIVRSSGKFGHLLQRHSISRSISARTLLTLAIETSCDDTCVAILSKNNNPNGELYDQRTRLHFNEKITAGSNGYGGIHPIEALDSHRSNLAKLITKSLEYLPDVNPGNSIHHQTLLNNGELKQKPDFISVTRGPGMRSNLACGLDTAKGLATAWQIPFVGVHHMQAHALTPRLVDALEVNILEGESPLESETQPQFPFLTLLVSGGHTMLVQSKSLTEHTILANTVDIAIGDALDKCGRMILPEKLRSSLTDTAYGKHLSRFAFPDSIDFTTWSIPPKRNDEIDKPLNKFGWQLQASFSDTRDLKFSFASLPSRVESILKQNSNNDNYQDDISPEERLLLAKTAIGIAFEHLASRTIIALELLQKESLTRRDGNQQPQPTTLVVSGGVASNNFLRYYLRKILDIRGFKDINHIFPPIELCTDNAAMIAWAGMEMYEAGYTTDLSCDALRKWDIGGILDTHSRIKSPSIR